MKDMPNHPRLILRGTKYYHRAAIPTDIKDTYPKAEELKSLRTGDYHEAIKLVRIEATRVDRLFDEHRRRAQLPAMTPAPDLTAVQLQQLRELYYAMLLEEDEDTRIEGFSDEGPRTVLFVDQEQIIQRGFRLPNFEEHEATTVWLDEETRKNFARGKVDDFFIGEAEDLLKWDNVEINLPDNAPSIRLLARGLQKASIEANKVILACNKGDVIDTPAVASNVNIARNEPRLCESFCRTLKASKVGSDLLFALMDKQ